MDSQLQMFALVAAMANKSLRKSLDVQDFDGDEQQVAQALTDGKSKEARERVKQWLARKGIQWDGTADIGETILNSLKETNRLRRARDQLRGMQHVLQFPNLAGRKAVNEALETLKAIEGVLNGSGKQSLPVGEPDSRPAG